jgi:hypothetical protein
VQPAVLFGYVGVARSGCHLFTNPLKSYNFPSYRSTPHLLLNSPYAAPVSPSVPTPSPLRLMKSPFSDTSNIITLGMETAAQIRSITDGNALRIGVRVSPAGRMKNTAHPSTTEQVMMSAQTGGRHLCSEDRSYHQRYARFWRVSVSHTHVDTLKCPAWNTAQRTYPTTALHINDPANAMTRNVKSVSNA